MIDNPTRMRYFISIKELGILKCMIFVFGLAHINSHYIPIPNEAVGPLRGEDVVDNSTKKRQE